MPKYQWQAEFVRKGKKQWARVNCLVCEWAHDFKPGSIHQLKEAFDWAERVHGGVH